MEYFLHSLNLQGFCSFLVHGVLCLCGSLAEADVFVIQNQVFAHTLNCYGLSHVPSLVRSKGRLTAEGSSPKDCWELTNRKRFLHIHCIHHTLLHRVCDGQWVIGCWDFLPFPPAELFYLKTPLHVGLKCFQVLTVIRPLSVRLLWCVSRFGRWLFCRLHWQEPLWHTWREDNCLTCFAAVFTFAGLLARGNPNVSQRWDFSLKGLSTQLHSGFLSVRILRSYWRRFQASQSEGLSPAGFLQ